MQRLWECISEEADADELTDEQRDELDRRLETHRKNPQVAVSWDDIRERLRGKE